MNVRKVIQILIFSFLGSVGREITFPEHYVYLSPLLNLDRSYTVYVQCAFKYLQTSAS